MKSAKSVLSICVVVALLLTAYSDTYYLQASDGPGQSAIMGTGANWKNAAGDVQTAPQAGNDYVIDGMELSPTIEKLEPRFYGDWTFAGDALYVNCRDLAFFGNSFTCANMIAGGEAGALMLASGASQTLYGRITVLPEKSLSFWMVGGGAFYVYSDLYGEGTCYLRGHTADAKHVLSLSGDNSHFTGRFSDTNTSDYKRGQRLVFASGTSWFGNPQTFDAESVRWTNCTYVEFTASQELATPNRGIFVDNGSQLKVQAGCTVGVGAPVKSESGFEKTGAGTLVLRSASPDLAGTLTVSEGVLGGGCPQAFGTAKLSLAAGATLFFASTNGPLVLAAAPTGTYSLLFDLKTLAAGNGDVFDLPEAAAIDLDKITVANSGYALETRTESGRLLVRARAVEGGMTFYLRGDDPQGTSSFAGTGAGWTNSIGQVQSAPEFGYEYVIDGYEARSRQWLETVFAGDALYLSRKHLVLCSDDSSALVCSNLIADADGILLNAGNRPQTLRGTVSVLAGANLGLWSYNAPMTIESAIRGTGTLRLLGNQGIAVTLAGDNSQFFGRCVSTNRWSMLAFASQSAWFGNPEVFDPDSLGWTNSMTVVFDCSLVADTPNRGVRLDAPSNDGRTVISVAANQTAELNLPLTAPVAFKKDGDGVLILSSSRSTMSGYLTILKGALGGTCSNAFDGVTLVLDPDSTLRFCSTNGPYALAVAPAMYGTDHFEVDLDRYAPPNAACVTVDLLRLPPDAAFDASHVALRRLRPVRHEEPPELIVRRTETKVLVSARFKRKVGTRVSIQ